ncbi:CDGSH iron-sulfur domain-containing protein [Halanaerobium kushneri]|jgi:CDGSH-type Zn-finger protein|uniref:Zn-finger domain of CDGSH type-containing protein n=1 Tax=Halanaerobium kushneri TaxID=56779 RepID=A0A1N6P970_9FIRM|nr:CDGSH iron-sulfur domain-containing protein [Halanaerobium kushneri]SIQ00914.1 Zn-finger domain of CDGSH type-containing protein [Halanaerobium kushneri]
MTEKKQLKIKIIKDGPYCVFGAVPLSEKIITPVGKHYEYREGKKLPQKENYSLCRCGETKTPPFCDGYHNQIDFDGKETASKLDYKTRAELLEGKEIDLRDDHRCAFLRFCHTEKGDTWNLIKESDKKEERELALKSAEECLAGRLTAVSKSGEILEKEFEPAIEILQDPEKNVGSAIIVKGQIEIEGADGERYEPRNSVALCRCGKSDNKPFCDCSHVHVNFQE